MNLKKLPSAVLFTSILYLVSVMLSSCGPVYELSVVSGSGGRVTVSPSGSSFHENEIITLNADADSGCYFTGWGNISGYSSDDASSAEVTIIMPAEPIEITAGFALPGKGWTFLLYIAGDNSLSSNAVDDINEMEEGLYDALQAGNTDISSDVKVLALADFAGSSDTALYLISPDNSPAIVSTRIEGESFPSSSELNLGDPDTLSDFIRYGLTKYPSEYNALILWNHGGGAKSVDFNTLVSREICQDLTSGDILYNNEVQQGISSGLDGANLSGFDLIGMDACLMGTVETAYELRDLGLYFAASPAEEWGPGWDYQRLLGNFSESGVIPVPAEMADLVISQYKESTDTESTSTPNTMTAVDLSRMETLKEKIDLLAAALHSSYTSSDFEIMRDADTTGFFYDPDSSASILSAPYTDLYSFCSGITGAGAAVAASDVIAALDAAVVGCYAETSGLQLVDYYQTDDSAAVRGLSIFISHGENGDYEDHWWYTDQEVLATIVSTGTTVKMGSLDFCTSDTDGTVETWRELFEAWY